MKELIKKQFSVDFNCPVEALDKNTFVTYKSDNRSRYRARSKGSIVCYDGKVYVRTEEDRLTQKLKSKYNQKKSDWFLEIKNLQELKAELAEFDLKIESINPFFIPIKEKIITDNWNERFVFIKKEDIPNFKENKRITEAFCYSENDPDQIGLAYYEGNELKAICGANWNGKYTWEIGIEVLDHQFEKQGIATELVRGLTSKILFDQPNVLIVYSTSFSHINSMNVAINSGFKIGWTEITFN
ncbi:hypothetical protein [Vagococcus sp.]|uniref:Predicted acetyltransferase n=2 Tax=Vagococcus fluvialis TaxID=2738 RepID=A0A1X6WM69_9ENTE|nr:hypothetical protein [Vagococcus sp.]SLM85441.1 Predicted acetyltransferase [Vagococcus fluvialis bH819]HCM89266.1 hypothetical protein [Vagococcus sp.]